MKKQNIWAKLADIFKEHSETNLEAAALADGTVVEADAFEVGMLVTVPVEDGEAIPLPEGAYDLDNGNTIQVDETGTITAIAPTESEEPEAEGGEVEAKAKPPMEKEQMKAKKVVESQTMTKETTFSKEEVDQMIAKAIEEKKVELEAEQFKKLEILTAKFEALETKLSEMPAERPLSRAPKLQERGPIYKEPKTRAQRLLNFSQNLKTEEAQ